MSKCTGASPHYLQQREATSCSLRPMNGAIMHREDSDDITFYHDKLMLEASELGIKLAVRYDTDIPDKAVFHQYEVRKCILDTKCILMNKTGYCICITTGDNPRLASLTKKDVDERSGTVSNKIVIFTTAKCHPQAGNCALYFEVGDHYYYICPTKQNVKLFREERVKGRGEKAKEELMELNRKHLYFTNYYNIN